jgi:hypothetical protein
MIDRQSRAPRAWPNKSEYPFRTKRETLGQPAYCYMHTTSVGLGCAATELNMGMRLLFEPLRRCWSGFVFLLPLRLLFCLLLLRLDWGLSARVRAPSWDHFLAVWTNRSSVWIRERVKMLCQTRKARGACVLGLRGGSPSRFGSGIIDVRSLTLSRGSHSSQVYGHPM